MAERFDTTELERVDTAAIRRRVTIAELAEFVASALPEVWAEVHRQELKPLAPPYVRFHDAADGEVEVEAGVMVAAAPEPEGRVAAAELPGGTAATGWHEGPYAELGRTRAEMDAWVSERGLVPAGGHWEVYWVNTGSTPDPERWRTQLFWPVHPAPESDPE